MVTTDRTCYLNFEFPQYDPNADNGFMSKEDMNSAMDFEVVPETDTSPANIIILFKIKWEASCYLGKDKSCPSGKICNPSDWNGEVTVKTSLTSLYGTGSGNSDLDKCMNDVQDCLDGDVPSQHTAWYTNHATEQNICFGSVLSNPPGGNLVGVGEDDSSTCQDEFLKLTTESASTILSTVMGVLATLSKEAKKFQDYCVCGRQPTFGPWVADVTSASMVPVDELDRILQGHVDKITETNLKRSISKRRNYSNNI
tara:strand:+ start:5344 stop:6108 length:765 start_codon:yes stop_codon:yes gene_type:complete